MERYKPKAKYIKHNLGWSFTKGRREYRIYASQSDASKPLLANFVDFAGANYFQCRIDTWQLHSHAALSAEVSRLMGRKHNADFSHPGKMQVHQ